MKPVLLARHAMHTRFEMVLHGASEPRLRAAGEEALDEIERLDAQLSVFRPTSEIARVNRHAYDRPVKVTPPIFRLLALARELSRRTEGAFDPTVGPLLRAWGFLGAGGAWPEPAALEAARACVGMGLVLLDEEQFTVRFQRPGLMLDLGAIGKGFAVDCAVAILREAGVTSAFVHGGTSSAYGLGAMPDGRPWKAALSLPGPPGPNDGTAPVEHAGNPRSGAPCAEAILADTALGVSASAGKAFRFRNRTFGHILDPRTGEPTQGALLAAVSGPSATEADALSTALLVLGASGLERVLHMADSLRAWIVMEQPNSPAGWCIIEHSHTGALRPGERRPL